MDSLFSHGNSTAKPTSAEPDEQPAALVVEVTVPQPLDDSFAGFVDGIHLWWPADQTRFGDGTHPEFTDGALFEEDPSGRSALWATLLDASSQSGLELAWHHQGNPNLSSHVAISFLDSGSATEVRVMHDGWAHGELGYEQLEAAPDWGAALAHYRRFMGGTA